MAASSSSAAVSSHPLVSNQPLALVVFVVGIAPRSQDGRDYGCTYGTFYDSTRLAGHNLAQHLPCNAYHPPTASAAVFQVSRLPQQRWSALQAKPAAYATQGVRDTINDAPRYHSLIIETDDRWVVDTINSSSYKRKHAQRSSENYVVSEILDLIEARTQRGDVVVDIIYSGNDSSAKRGLRLARK